MEAARRRERVLDRLSAATTPVPAATLGSELGVSRQIVVGDVALLRAAGQAIRATNRGYVLARPTTRARRSFHVQHGPELVEAELDAVIDAGGTLLDLSIPHAAYGQVTVDLLIRNHEDIAQLLEQLRTSPPLSQLTNGDHFHTVEADDEATLDAVREALDALGVLVHED
ncbi:MULTISPECIES: transcription repressor NadR [unclassified Actinomyces]|nr:MULTISPECIES: transcription repressor NadR [unclassified Actinomyces]MCL3777840.1 transcription repressor NadR [Actinomyces sp. AC-20-1]MCL3790919.1 transcription repressor NadR [Actinomyces sp. 187325]MCL3792267.1 transcription repressor NadR [Actinomyces sp. 186855]MCL3795443.1 transcription repressor NadR [Actinomyces sp. 217892]